MRKISLVANYGIDREADKEAVSDIEVSRNYILYAIRKAYEKGLSSDKRRILVKLQERFDQILKDKQDFIEMNEVEYIFVRDAFSKAIVTPEEAKFFTLAEDLVLAATSEKTE